MFICCLNYSNYEIKSFKKFSWDTWLIKTPRRRFLISTWKFLSIKRLQNWPREKLRKSHLERASVSRNSLKNRIRVFFLSDQFLLYSTNFYENFKTFKLFGRPLIKKCTFVSNFGLNTASNISLIFYPQFMVIIFFWKLYWLIFISEVCRISNIETCMLIF